MRLLLILPAAFVFVSSASSAQITVLHSAAGREASRTLGGQPSPASSVTEAALRGRFTKADGSGRGELWLQVSADTRGGPLKSAVHVNLRIPLASTEDVYGESRSCTVSRDGTRSLTFTAGMDEANFLRFAVGAKPLALHLLLNKYLCRALAAPFHCKGTKANFILPQDWSYWTLGRSMTVALTSSAAGSVELSPVTVTHSRVAFNPVDCARLAPSNGMCCVAGKATEWHCGGTPAGPGWHQVSGQCFHRETGKACDAQSIFSLFVNPDAAK